MEKKLNFWGFAFAFLISISIHAYVLLFYKNFSFKFIKEQKNCIFSRLTGSGSTCVGYFKNFKSAQKAKKNIIKKFPNYWCERARTI